MITKEKLKAQIESFPENISIDELIDKLLFVEKLENRVEEEKKKDAISEEDLKNEMDKWFK